MRCKKCGTATSPAVVAETLHKIGAICQGLGMTAEAAGDVANSVGPLCRKCMSAWGSNEEDLKPPC